jgi:hypothetical protein
MPLTLDAIQQAAERIRPYTHRTPIMTCEALNQQVGAAAGRVRLVAIGGSSLSCGGPSGSWPRHATSPGSGARIKVYQSCSGRGAPERWCTPCAGTESVAGAKSVERRA